MILLAVIFFIAFILFILVWYVVGYEPSHFILRERIFSSKKIRKEISILHLSDFHFKKHLPKTFYPFIKRLVSLNADMIVMTGDLTHEEEGMKHLEYLLDQFPAGKVFAVLGNHDMHSYSPIHRILPVNIKPKKRDYSALLTLLKKKKVKLLRNQLADVPGEKVEFWGAEYTDDVDPVPPQPRFSKVKNKFFNCVLVHSPDLIPFIQNWEDIDLLLAGHTHGGQVRFPVLGHVLSRTSYLKKTRKLVDGLNDYKGAKIHVVRGLGQGVVMRFRCYPEAVLLRVKPVRG